MIISLGYNSALYTNKVILEDSSYVIIGRYALYTNSFSNMHNSGKESKILNELLKQIKSR